MIRKMAQALNINEGFAEKCEKVLKEYVAFQERLNQLILG